MRVCLPTASPIDAPPEALGDEVELEKRLLEIANEGAPAPCSQRGQAKIAEEARSLNKGRGRGKGKGASISKGKNKGIALSGGKGQLQDKDIDDDAELSQGVDQATEAIRKRPAAAPLKPSKLPRGELDAATARELKNFHSRRYHETLNAARKAGMADEDAKALARAEGRKARAEFLAAL